VTMMSGMPRVAASAFRRRHTSHPSSFGIARSSTTHTRLKTAGQLDGLLAACCFVNDEAGGTERQLIDLALGIVIVNQDDRGHLAERSDRYLDDSRRKKLSQLEPGAGVEPATY